MLWFLTAPIMSATITELRDSKYTRWRNINVTQLEVATVRERGEERESVCICFCMWIVDMQWMNLSLIRTLLGQIKVS